MSESATISPQAAEADAGRRLAREMGQADDMGHTMLMLLAAEEFQRLRRKMSGQREANDRLWKMYKDLWGVIGRDEARLSAVLLEIEYGAPQ